MAPGMVPPGKVAERCGRFSGGAVEPPSFSHEAKVSAFGRFIVVPPRSIAPAGISRGGKGQTERTARARLRPASILGSSEAPDRAMGSGPCIRSAHRLIKANFADQPFRHGSHRVDFQPVRTTPPTHIRKLKLVAMMSAIGLRTAIRVPLFV